MRTQGFEDADDLPITERAFHRLQESLRKLYRDANVREEVRRRILEASVRAPQDWHEDAIRAAYSSGDEVWRLTAVFCMRFLRGFDKQIVEELENENPDIQLEAVLAAADWGVAAGWPQIAALIHSGRTPKPLLLAAIEAVPAIRPQEASEVLSGLIESDDEDIIEAVQEALAIAEEPAGEGEDDEDDIFPE